MRLMLPPLSILVKISVSWCENFSAFLQLYKLIFPCKFPESIMEELPSTGINQLINEYSTSTRFLLVRI